MCCKTRASTPLWNLFSPSHRAVVKHFNALFHDLPCLSSVSAVLLFFIEHDKKALSQLVISHGESYSQDDELRLVAGQSILLQHQVEPGLVELALHLFICLVGLPWA